ncbi:hypothetical protein KSP39_PZI022763 [Platanthera zijinensis]|uniref:Poly A polymerase head domain-containing protein n=1 Tax=Platanthera zijinensis TaxID=2320716 RepID=A0AAP0AVK7_9ASPA
MALSRRIRGILSSRSLLCQLKALTLDLQGRNYTVGTVMGSGQDEEGPNDTNWKIVDSKTLKIKSESILPSAMSVLNTLQGNGYAAYLVGGCVRDLILKRAPKDFDVITTASLRQIKEHFRRCRIIGRRFPICHVHILGDVVEVSSFDTVAKHGDDQEAIISPKLSKNYNEKDLTCWKNCMKRDFSINCLFFDPFKCKIYDYVDALKDLKSCTVRTVISPHLSFKEDCARILRGMRIAARLGLRFSKKTEAAILDLSSSIQSLGKKLLVNADNLLRADRPCCCNLCHNTPPQNIHQKPSTLIPASPATTPSNSTRFALFLLLVLHSSAPAPLSTLPHFLCPKASLIPIPSSMFLPDTAARLFLSRECPEPTPPAHDSPTTVRNPPCAPFRCSKSTSLSPAAPPRLGLLAFHLALVDNPQDALVIWTFSSILYHGAWNEAVEFAKGSSNDLNQFVPEIAESSTTMPDNLLFRKTFLFESLAKSAVKILTDIEVLQQSLVKYGLSSQCSVFVSQKTGTKVRELFDVMKYHGDCGGKRGKSRRINYKLLKSGDLNETRFVLGKIIMDTMKGKPISKPNQSFPAAERGNKGILLSTLF